MNKEMSFLGFGLSTMTELASFVLKMALAIGGGCLIFYFIRIGYFPSGVSFGDTILLLMVSICFGFICAIVIGSYVYIGVCFSFLIRNFVAFIVWGVSKTFSKEKKSTRFNYAKFQWISIIVAPFGVMVIYTISDKTWYSLSREALSILLVYVIYSQNLNISRKILKYKGLVKKINSNPERLIKLNDLRLKMDKFYFLTVISLIIIPLFYGGLAFAMLDKSMELTGVRISHATVYIKNEYAPIFVSEGGEEISSNMKDYNKFKNIIIAFSGFGDKTALLIDGNSTVGVISIPNDSLIFHKNK